MPLTTPPVVEERSNLGEHRTSWDDLVARQPLPSPFLRSWWLAETAPDADHLLVLRGERLIGGLVLGRRRLLGVTRHVAPGPLVLCPDHLDVVAEPEAVEEVRQALRHWFDRPGQRLVDVGGLVEGSLLERVLGVTAVPADRAPWHPLDPAAGFLQERSSSFRRNVRRGRRRLEDLGFEHRAVPPAEVPDALGQLRVLHEDREGRHAFLGELDRLADAVAAGARRGEARVDVLASPDRVIAVSVAFVLAGRLSLYQIARSTEREHGSAGTVLLAAVIEDALESGCHEVDMLRGDEDYKSSFADHTRTLGRVRAARGGWARVVLGVEDAARGFSARLRSRAGSGA